MEQLKIKKKITKNILKQILNAKSERRYNKGSVLYEIYKDNELHTKMTYDDFYNYVNNIDRTEMEREAYDRDMRRYGGFSEFM
jgi:hypothetical protein